MHNVPAQSASRRTDARAIRSGAALRDSLLDLLEHEPLDQITIRQITAAADVSYATFFRHHPTKEALLDRVAADQIDRLVALTLPILDRTDSVASVRALCAYVADHRPLWTTLLTGGAAGAMRKQLLQISRALAVDRAPIDSWLPTELAVNCTVSLIFETLAWWLLRPLEDIATADIASTLHRLLSSLVEIG